MTRKQFLAQYGNKRMKDVAGILHIYLAYESVDKHYELENQIMLNDSAKVKDTLHILDNLLEFESET